MIKTTKPSDLCQGGNTHIISEEYVCEMVASTRTLEGREATDIDRATDEGLLILNMAVQEGGSEMTVE